MNTINKESETYKFDSIKTICIDITILSIIYFVPTFCHLLNFPLYIMDPMRVMLFIGYFLVRDKKNAFILAITLPLVSTICSGHPIFPKFILIMLELSLNIALLLYFSRYLKNYFIPILFSIFLSKLFYYTLKYICVSYGLLHTHLIDTPIAIQVAMMIAISLLFAFGDKLLKQRTDEQRR